MQITTRDLTCIFWWVEMDARHLGTQYKDCTGCAWCVHAFYWLSTDSFQSQTDLTS